MESTICVCECGVMWMPVQGHGWRRMCKCKPTSRYWLNRAPIPADGVAFHQLTGHRVPKRAGIYLYGTHQGAGGGE